MVPSHRPRRTALAALAAALALAAFSGCTKSSTPAPAAEADTGSDYAGAVFQAANPAGDAASSEDFAAVNPFGYQNPWG